MESGLQILKKWTIKAPHGTSQRSREKSDKKPQKQQKVEQTHQIEDNHADVDMEGSKGSDRGENENESPPSQSDTPKETESPRFQALLRMTGGPKKKKLGNDIKSYSHELDPRGVRSHDYWKLHSFNDLEKFLGALRAKFNSAKEEVNNELKVFAVDLIEILERHADQSPSWQEQAEDLLVLARKCTLMSPNEFRKQCDKIVAELDDKRQMLPMGILKQLHTRMLFILTRCTRLLQFQKSSSSDEEIPTHKSHQLTNFSQPLDGAWTLRNSDKGKTKISIHDLSRQKEPFEKLSNPLPSASSSLGPKKPEDQGTTSATSKKNDRPKPFLGDGADLRQDKVMSEVDSLIQDRLRSWKRSTVRPDTEGKDKQAPRKESLEREDGATTGQDPLSRGFGGQQQTLNSSSRQQSLGTPTPRVAWGYWGDQPTAVEDLYFVICRICEEEVPTLSLEEHSKVCAFVDRCDHKSQNIDERLLRLADALERMLESYTPKASAAGSTLSPEPGRVLSGPGSTGDLLESIFDKSYGLNRKGSEDMLEDLHDLDAASIDDPKGSFSAMTCKTRFGPKSDVGVASSSGGSLTPRSPVATPRVASQFDQWLPERNSLVEPGDPIQMSELADIARCVANSNPADHYSVEYLYSCMQDLAEVLQQNKIVALTVDTFGKRIEKLLREKYTLVCDLAEQNGLETSSNGPDEEGCYMEDDGFPSRQSTPVHPSSLKDRTTINDFEIIKPISRGAFGRVFLARKRTTGDLFAIKVLRKVDMIRKNQVESVQAERNILISARNPFVVRFFYSFTCRENLYLVMEYLNGGDLYSMLRNMGCLPEHIARHYIAELVLALEYLHSLGVVHRDLKPDNLLIAHDGHIKLTDFGLSRVGLINSTDDLSGPAAVCIQVEEPSGSAEEHSRRERRQQQSAVGTPDYLAPEILLGTGHGTTADWWSTGVILFEFLTGVPPFNADHPQVIFDNILNRKIPWPHVPEEMSDEAQDLIDRLLTEDPNERLGARGAAEVKAHPFFKDIEWDTLARQKAAFVPSPDTAHDTSYFITRSAWNQSDSRVFPENDLGDSTDLDCSNSSGSNSSMDAGREEGEDECREIPPFDSHVHWSFSNFSFKNLSQLASINYDILFQTERSSPKGPS